MSKSRISDEAVESAAKATYYTSGRSRVMPYSEARNDCLKEAREVLEAAAPYLIAKAWDEGERAGYYNSDADQCGLPAEPNPYRK